MPNLRLLVAVFLTLAFSACNVSTRGAGPGDDGGAGSDASATACTEGSVSCQGQTAYRCQGGNWVMDRSCAAPEMCFNGVGCAVCPANGTGCDGDRVVQCDAAGHLTNNVVTDCSPSTCVNGACASPCSPEALAHSNLGCVYFAVKLPQGTNQQIGNEQPAATQQFAVAVANPGTSPVVVVVDRNDAKFHAPPQIAEVAKKTVAPGALVVIPLPDRQVNGFILGKATNRSLLTANAYRITADRPVTAYQFNPENNSSAFSNGASLLIPVNALDASYVALGWPGVGGVSLPGFGLIDKNSFLTIVATRANTHVRVTPAANVMAGDNVPALAKSKPWVVTLGEFETLNLEGADAVTFGAADFTGSRIEADGPVAVWSGNECADIFTPNMKDGCCCDHMEEQLFPRSSLGSDYIVLRSAPRNIGMPPESNYFRILALDDGTTVSTSLPAPDDKFTLAAGAMRQIYTPLDFTLSASHPVTIGQFLLSHDFVSPAIGDPSFAQMPPLAQYRGHYVFSVPANYSQNFANLSVLSGTTPNLDGVALQGCARTPVGALLGKSYDSLHCPVSVGAHKLDAADPFALIVEGWGPGAVSYSYPGGMNFAPVNQDCTTGSCPMGEFCSGGVCVPTIQ